MIVQDAKFGDIIQIGGYGVCGRLWGLNCYQVVGRSYRKDAVKCRTRFTHDPIHIIASNDCRIVDPATIDGF